LSAALLLGQTARAESAVKSGERVSSPSNTAPRSSRWYGWQMLTADGAVVLMGVTALGVGEHQSLLAGGSFGLVGGCDVRVRRPRCPPKSRTGRTAVTAGLSGVF